MKTYVPRRSPIASLALCLAPLLCGADGAMDTARLRLIPQRLQEAVDQNMIAGAVALVARHGEIVSLDAVGMQDIENAMPMRTDSIVQIMSMTKSFTGVAAMLLVEEGKLDLSRPVQDYLPEFKSQVVERRAADGSISTHRPRNPAKVWQLMTHMSGFDSSPADRTHIVTHKMDRTLGEVVQEYALEKLTSEPGTKYVYSNLGIAVLGRVVEVVSGQEFAHFVERRILAPLGMKDSFFYPPKDKLARIAMVYRREGGKLIPMTEGLGGDPRKYRAGSKYPGPEFGLFSTAADLLRFYSMLGQGGVLDGRRHLSKQSVAAMTHDYSPDRRGTGLTLMMKGAGPRDLLHLYAPGTFGHAGAFGTNAWIDPANDLLVIALAQITSTPTTDLYNSIRQIAVAALP